MGRKAHSLPSCQSYKFTSHCKSQAGYSSPHVPLTWVALQATLHPWICFQTLLLVIKSQTQGDQSTNKETTNQTALLLAEAPVQSFLTVVSTFLDYTHRNPSLLTYNPAGPNIHSLLGRTQWDTANHSIPGSAFQVASWLVQTQPSGN